MSSLLVRGFLLGFAVAASPGPIFFLCVRRTLVSGRLTGLFSGFGVATVDGFYAAVATFGVAALTALFVAGRRPLALVGGLLLVGLGVRILLERVSAEPVVAQATGRGLAWAYASTVGLGTSGSPLRPALVTGGVLLGSAAWWCVLVVSISLLRARLTPRVVGGISVFSGAAIVSLGILAVVSAFSR